MHADLQRLMNEDLVSDLPKTELSLLRDTRTDMTAAEGDVSFVRRVAQGRLDIVGHESARRAAGVEPGAQLESELLYDIPDILAEVTGRPDRRAPIARAEDSTGAVDDAEEGRDVPRRKVQVGEPGPIAVSLLEELDEAGSSSDFGELASLNESDIADLMERLQLFERNLSEVRRVLHDRIDTIQNEIGRRYRDGEVSVDSVLNNLR